MKTHNDIRSGYSEMLLIKILWWNHFDIKIQPLTVKASTGESRERSTHSSVVVSQTLCGHSSRGV